MFNRWLAVPFIDFLLLLVGVTVLMAHPILSQQKSQSKPVADFALYVAWDLGRNTDVDVYVQGPDGKVAWFSRKDVGYMSIDRDDLGRVRDSGPLNQEIVAFRAPLDGSYLVSVHTYRENAEGPGTVALELSSRDGKNLWHGQVPIPAYWQEAPVIEFVFRGGAFVASYPSTALIRQGAKREPVA